MLILAFISLEKTYKKRYMYVWVSEVAHLCLTLWDPMDCSLTRFLRPWDFPGKDTGVGCHFLIQEIFPTQGLNLGLLHCRPTLYCLSHQGSPPYTQRNHNSKRHLHSNVHCSTIYNSQDIEPTWMPITEEWIKNMWYVYTVEYCSAIKRTKSIHL